MKENEKFNLEYFSLWEWEFKIINKNQKYSNN